MQTTTLTDAIAAYRTARDAYLAAQAKADDAWDAWFNKLSRGIPTNGAAASRLANLANYASADLDSAQSALYRFDLDPATVDAQDGVDRDVHY